MKGIKLKDIIENPDTLNKLTIPQLQDVLQKVQAVETEESPKRWDGPAEMALELSAGTKKPWKPAAHLLYLSKKLAALGRGTAEKNHLMVSMPPRSGKSLLCSFWFPLWLLSEDPTRQVLFASYGRNYAETWGRKVRNFVDSRGKEIGLKLRRDTRAAGEWYTTEDGGMFSTGAEGEITGRGTTALIIDDPIKNDEEARSEVIRETKWDWWQSTAYSRLEPDGFCLMIATRWHEDDLLGRLEAQMKDGGGLDWDIVKFPAYAEDNDVLGRNVGDVLWPEERPKSYYESKRATMTAFAWGALFQQRPTPEEGGAIKADWWRFYHKVPEEFDEIIQAWDLAFKDLKKSDYCVGAVWGRIGAKFFLLDVVRKRMDFPATLQAVRLLTMRWPKSKTKLIEDAANGPAVAAALHSEIPGILLWPPKGHPHKRSSKDERLSGVSYLFQSGNVYVPTKEMAPWVEDFIHEHMIFPNGTNDDQVDTTSMALEFLRPKGKSSINKDWNEALEAVGTANTSQELLNRQFHKDRKKWLKKDQKDRERRSAPDRSILFRPRAIRAW